MLAYISRRIFGAICTLFLLTALTFFLLRLAPGGPFDSDQAWPPEIQANMNQRYGLDMPVTTQFRIWLTDLTHGDLRESFQFTGRPISELIEEALPPSALLGGCALFISLILGIPMGCIAAWKQKSWIDQFISAITVSGLSLPSYLLASLLILIFSLKLNWLPPALWENYSSMVLPMITLSWRPMAIIARLTRISMLEVSSSDYIRTAYGKGLSEIKVVFKHSLINSLVPVITALGPIAANLITGSFLVEVIFQIPGLGKYFVQAILNRDYPLVMGVTLTYGVILIVANLIVDILYSWIDPRIRIGVP